MSTTFDGNYTAYWPSYNPCPYSNNSYETMSPNSSYFESTTSSCSPPMMSYPFYDQQQSCYYYTDLSHSYHQCTSPSPPFMQTSQIVNIPSASPSVNHLSTNQPNRLQYTNRQRWLLNEIFENVPYPNSVQKNVIADRIGATREQIRIWFQNRRRIAVQSHRSSSRRSNPVPVEHSQSIRIELEQILSDLDLHKNAPQRMPIGSGTSSCRRTRTIKK